MSEDVLPNTVDTELPTAAALADGSANPTVPAVGAFLMIRNPNDGNWYRAGASDGNSDAFGNFAVSQAVTDYNLLYDPSAGQWNRARGNYEVSILASASRTTTQTGSDQVNYNGRGLHVVLDMTVVGTGSVTLAIQGKDAVSGKYYAILTGAVVNTNSTNVYRVYPDLTPAANATVNDVLPRTWRIVVTANNANAATYSVGASVIL